MMDSSPKQAALEQIAVLAKEHDLTLDDIGAKLTQDAVKDKSGKWLTRLLGYLGAAFIFGGLALYIGMVWDDLNSAARVIITYGPGITAFVLGIMVLKDERFERASTPLFLKSAVLLPTGMFVFLKEYAEGDDAQLAAMIVFGILAIQYLAPFMVVRRTSLLFFGFLFWNTSVGIMMDRAGIDGDMLGITLGLSIMAVAWAMDKTVHRAIAPFYYFIGGFGFLWSVFEVIEGEQILDLVFLPITVAMMLVSTRMHSRTLLLVSTFALLGFLGYFTEEYFADVTGWPIALIIMGFMLIGISAYAIRLGKNMKRA